MLGGLGSARWNVIWVPAICVLLGLVALRVMARGLNALMSGEQTAISLGFNGRRLRIQVFLCTSLLTGVLVSLGFEHVADQEDPEVGPIWEWRWTRSVSQ